MTTTHAPLPKKDSSFRPNVFAVDGLDGCGKSTVLAALKAALEARGVEVEIILADKGCPEALAHKQNITPDMDPIETTRHIAAARQATVEHLIMPARKAGKVVLLDRWHNGSYAYQGNWPLLPQDSAEFEERLSAIDEIVSTTTGDFSPEMTYILDLPAKTALNRLRQDKTKRNTSFDDFFEKRGSLYFDRVRKTFCHIANQQPEIHKVVNAEQPPEAVLAEIYEDICNRLGLENERPINFGNGTQSPYTPPLFEENSDPDMA